MVMQEEQEELHKRCTDLEREIQEEMEEHKYLTETLNPNDAVCCKEMFANCSSNCECVG